MTNLQPKVCPECQFEESKFMSYKYTPHAPDCSRNKPVSKLQELKKDFEKWCGETTATFSDDDEYNIDYSQLSFYHELLKKHEDSTQKAYALGQKDMLERVNKVRFYIQTTEPAPDLNVYLDKVKNGNKDDMYDYGVKIERELALKALDNLN